MGRVFLAHHCVEPCRSHWTVSVGVFYYVSAVGLFIGPVVLAGHAPRDRRR